MGTRADFYVGRGADAEWLGSIAMDGFPDSIDEDVIHAGNLHDYRAAVSRFLAATSHATLPEEGWPWPWEDSQTTDYAYAFENGQTWASSFGHAWFRADEEEPDDESSAKPTVFPQMDTSRFKRPGSRGSGCFMISFPPEDSHV